MPETANRKLIDLPVDEARRLKWEAGRKEYGGDAFHGDPIEELFAELLDAINYAEEAQRQGIDVGMMIPHLRLLCEETKQIESTRYQAGGCRCIRAGGCARCSSN